MSDFARFMEVYNSPHLYIPSNYVLDMSWSLILVTACVAIYCLGTFFLWREAYGYTITRSNNGHARFLIPGLTTLAIVVHGYLLYHSIYSQVDSPGYSQVYSQGDPNISLGLAISMAGWISVALYLCISFIKKTINLGIIVLPLGLIAVLIGFTSVDATSTNHAFSINQISHNPIPRGMGWHIALAIPTYGILCVAFAQACLLIIQDRLLHKPNPGNRLPAFPAIQTMQANLFWLTLLGFLLMTTNLVVGMISNLKNFGALLDFNHHILFSILAWFCFACLLSGRKIAGWRGQTAAKWTIIAFGILFLAYFGTRFVNELLLSG